MFAYWFRQFLRLSSCLGTTAIAIFLVMPPALANTSPPTPALVKEGSLLAVELKVGGERFLKQVLIRQKAQDWLLPFEHVVKALELEVIPGDNQQLEVRSPTQNISLAPGTLSHDPQLGLVVSLDALQTILAVNSQLDQQTHQLNLSPPWLAYSQSIQEEPPLTLPPRGSSALQVKGNLQNLTLSYQDFGNNWYLQTSPGDPIEDRSLQMREGQYNYQSNSADYVLGIQPQLWLSQGPTEFLGFTTIRRWGFTPSSGGTNLFNYQTRIQAQEVGRTIAGKALPGTLLELVKPDTQEAIASVVVGPEGYYSFNQVPTIPGQVTQYQLRSYPGGDQTLTPRVETIKFATLPGQLPAGASLLSFSGGITRQLAPNTGFLGNLDQWQGGMSYRLAPTEDLTLGLGLFYNSIWKGIGELFYQPNNFPMQFTLAAVTSADGQGWEIHSQLRFNPLDNLGFVFLSDRFSQQLSFNWQAFPGFNLELKGTHRLEFLQPRLSLSYQSPQFSTFFQGEINPEKQLLWSLKCRLARWQFLYQEQTSQTLSEFSYHLDSNTQSNSGHWLFVSYQNYRTNFLEQDLTILGWRYRSVDPILNLGQWQISLGYGIKDEGNGFVASIFQELIPGLGLQLDYSTMVPFPEQPNFVLKLVPQNPFSP